MSVNDACNVQKCIFEDVVFSCKRTSCVQVSKFNDVYTRVYSTNLEKVKGPFLQVCVCVFEHTLLA